jgi:hypothetical protein
MRNIIISVNDQDIKVDDIEIGNSGTRIVDGYRVIKNIAPRNHNSHNKIHTSVMMKSTLIYDVRNKSFLKNRYGGCLSGNIGVLPGYLEYLFNAIQDIVNNEDYKVMIDKHRNSILIEAIYLTDTIDMYPKIDIMEYQLTRYMYGRELPQGALYEIYEKFPEKLI